MSLLASAVEAYYWYDGDGTLVKSEINSMVTYYVGRHYLLEDNAGVETVQKFYTAGNTQIAVRTITELQNTLTWILSDHLGSASITAHEDGTLKSEVRYTAFGETRPPSGTSDTPYQYTGQLSQMEEIGLYYFVARFYDPATAHFVQADTIVSDPDESKTYDRFAHTHNNPVKYTDPTGHCVSCLVVAIAGGVILGTAFYREFIWTPSAPPEAHASKFSDLLVLGIEEAGHATIVGEGLQSLQNDPSIQSAQREILADIRNDPRYGKQSFNVPLSQPEGFTANGPTKNWWDGAKSGNPAFWMVHTANLYATNTNVSEDGAITTKWKVDDKFDYKPAWKDRFDELKTDPGRYFAYNGFAQFIAPVYHGVLQAPQYKTNAYWEQTISPPSYLWSSRTGGYY